MKYIYWFLFSLFCYMVGIILATHLNAQTFLPKVDALSLGVKWTGEGKRDPYFPDYNDWENRVNLYWDISMWRYYMHSDTYMDTGDGEVQHVGWHYTQGVKIFSWLDIIHEHHSRHSADRTMLVKFPVEDYYGVKINFVVGEK